MSRQAGGRPRPNRPLRTAHIPRFHSGMVGEVKRGEVSGVPPPFPPLLVMVGLVRLLHLLSFLPYLLLSSTHYPSSLLVPLRGGFAFIGWLCCFGVALQSVIRRFNQSSKSCRLPAFSLLPLPPPSPGGRAYWERSPLLLLLAEEGMGRQ